MVRYVFRNGSHIPSDLLEMLAFFWGFRFGSAVSSATDAQNWPTDGSTQLPPDDLA